MNRKFVGAILLSSAGVVLTIGTVGAQIAYAIALAGFHARQILGGSIPPGPQDAYPHWLVIITALTLGATGISFLSKQEKE